MIARGVTWPVASIWRMRVGDTPAPFARALIEKPAICLCLRRCAPRTSSSIGVMINSTCDWRQCPSCAGASPSSAPSRTVDLAPRVPAGGRGQRSRGGYPPRAFRRPVKKTSLLSSIAHGRPRATRSARTRCSSRGGSLDRRVQRPAHSLRIARASAQCSAVGISIRDPLHTCIGRTSARRVQHLCGHSRGSTPARVSRSRIS